MIIGRYGDTSGRPYLEGRLVIPSQGLATNISFLVDAGADQTVLMPADAAKIGLSLANLTNASLSLGVGGYARDFVEPANVTFLGTSGNLYIYQIDIRISEAAPAIMGVPSLLGRNILDRWHISYAPSKGILEATVLDCDVTVRPDAP